MKLIPEKEKEDATIKYVTETVLEIGEPNITDLQEYSATDFNAGIEFAEQKITPLIIEFTKWIRNEVSTWNDGYVVNNGSHYIDTEEQLFEYYLKTR